MGQRQRGRPPLSRDKVLGHRVVTFLNDDLMQRVDEMSSTHGQSVSQTCRDLIGRAIQAMEREVEEEESMTTKRRGESHDGL